MKKPALIIIVVAIVVVVIGYYAMSDSTLGGSTPSHGRSSGGRTTTEQDSSSNQLAAFAPAFQGETLDGRSVSLADYQGEKPVILDFWASWCPNCRRDMPKLNTWYQKYQDDVEVIGVNLQETKRTALNYVDQQGIVFPIVLDPSAKISRQYGVQYTNVHVLIDRTGQIVRTIPGDIQESDIQSLIAI